MQRQLIVYDGFLDKGNYIPERKDTRWNALRVHYRQVAEAMDRHQVKGMGDRRIER